MAVNIRRAHRSLSLPTSPEHTVNKLTELRQTIQAHLSGTVPEAAVHEPLREFAHEERRRGTRAEKVVIALKRSWESLHNDRQQLSREDQLHLLDRLVTRCIDEYYTALPGPD